MDCSPAGSSDHGILQARILEWVAFPSSETLPYSGIEPGSPILQAVFTTASLGRPMYSILHSVISTLPGSFGYSMLLFCISHSKRTLENLCMQFPEV